MPITVESRTFTNPLTGTSGASYKANVGDLINCDYRIGYTIEFNRIVSGNFQFDYTNKTITLIDGLSSWLREGFAVGDVLRLTAYTSSGSIALTAFGGQQDYNVTVSAVTNTVITFSTALVPTIQSDHRLYIRSQVNYRDELGFLFNHIQSNQNFNEFSHIDGQRTLYELEGVAALPTGVTLYNLLPEGGLSGQFNIVNPQIQIQQKINGFMRVKLTFGIVVSGVYDYTLFDSGGFLRISTGFLATRTANDSASQLKIFDTLTNQSTFGFKNGTFSEYQVLISPQLNYNELTTSYTFKVRSTNPIQGMGFSHVPQIDTNFKNKPLGQSNYGYTVSTVVADGVGTNNDLAVPATVEIDNFTVVSLGGNEYNITFDLNKNQSFIDEFTNKTSGDRLFRIWLRIGGRNYILYDEQLVFKIPDPVAFEPDYFALLSDNDNVIDSSSGGEDNFEVEDSVGVLARIELQNFDKLKSLEVNVFVEQNTGYRFNLKEFTYIIDQSVMDVNGVYIIDDTIPLGYNLTTDNVKNDARVFIEIIDASSYYIVIHFPFLIRWESWKTLVNASEALAFWQFTPQGLVQATEEWIQYETPANYDVRVELRKNTLNLTEFKEVDLDFRGYDLGELSTTIQTFRLDGTNLNGNVIAGEVIRVRAIHTATAPITDGFATITVEGEETSPRWVVNSNIPDNNANNPLELESFSIVGNTMTINALYNPDVIPKNIVSFASKGYAVTAGGDEQNIEKVNAKKIVLPSFPRDEDRGFDKCCHTFQVRASNDLDSWKNDLSFIMQTVVIGTVSFVLERYQNGVYVDSGYSLGVNQLPKDANSKYVTIDWREVFQSAGTGLYRVQMEFEVYGIEINETLRCYQLLEYSPYNTKGTVRIRGVFNKYFMEQDWNFEGANLIDDTRIEGYFGSVKPNTIVNNLVYSSRNVKSITRENVKTYTLESKRLVEEEVNQLVDFTLLASEIKVTDYNPQNLSYQYLDKPVILNDEGGSIELNQEDGRKTSMTVQLKDANLNKKVFKL